MSIWNIEKNSTKETAETTIDLAEAENILYDIKDIQSMIKTTQEVTEEKDEKDFLNKLSKKLSEAKKSWETITVKDLMGLWIIIENWVIVKYPNNIEQLEGDKKVVIATTVVKKWKVKEDVNSSVTPTWESPEPVIKQTVVEQTPRETETMDLGNKITNFCNWSSSCLNKFKEAWVIIKENWRAFIENTEVREKVNKYIQVLNFISDVARDKDQKILNKWEVVENYLWILSEKSDFIKNKQYMAIKYLEAINNDILREGWIIKKDEKWIFYIDNLQGNANNFTEYQKIFSSLNQRKYIEVAMVTSIVKKDLENNNEAITKSKLYSKIFNDYGIEAAYVWQDWEVIRKKWEVATIDKIWKKVRDDYISQIEDKITKMKVTTSLKWNPELLQQIQELNLVKDYLSEEKWEENDYLTTILKEVNTYKNDFLTEKAIINALGSEWSYWEKIKWILEKKKWAVFLFWIIAWMMWYKKTAFWLMWVWVFWDSIWDMAKFAEKQILSNPDNEDINDIEFSDWAKEVLKNKNHQTKYNELYAFNKKGQRDWWWPENPAMDEKKLSYITRQISEKQINVDISWNDNKKATEKILALIEPEGFSSWKVETTEKKAKWVKKDSITKKDIEDYIKILTSSGLKESKSDKTTLDYLTNWQDILNKAYKYQTFTWAEWIDAKINEILEKKWNGKTDTTDTAKTRTADEDKEIRKQRKEIEELSWFIPQELSNMLIYYDNIKKWVKNAVKITFWEGRQEPYSSTEISVKIKNAVSKIWNIDKKLAKKIGEELEKYKKYLKLEEELSGFEWLYDENKIITQVKLEKLFWVWSVISLERDIRKKISILQELYVQEESLSKYKDFEKLNKKIVILLNNLVDSKDELVKNNKENLQVEERTNVVWDFTNENEVKKLDEEIKEKLKFIEETVEKLDKKSWILDLSKNVDETLVKDFGILNDYLVLKDVNTKAERIKDIEWLIEINKEESKGLNDSLKEVIKSWDNEAKKEIELVIAEYSEKLKNLEAKLIKTKAGLGLDTVKDFQQSIKDELAKFEEIKIKLKDNVVKWLKEVYERNTEQKNILGDLDVADISEATKVQKTINKLKEIKLYIENADKSKEELFRLEVGKFSSLLERWVSADETNKKYETISKNAKEMFGDLAIDNKFTLKQLDNLYKEKVESLMETTKEYLKSDNIIEQLDSNGLLEHAEYIKSLKAPLSWNKKIEKLIEKYLTKIVKRFSEVNKLWDLSIKKYNEKIVKWYWEDLNGFNGFNGLKKAFNIKQDKLGKIKNPEYEKIEQEIETTIEKYEDYKNTLETSLDEETTRILNEWIEEKSKKLKKLEIELINVKKNIYSNPDVEAVSETIKWLDLIFTNINDETIKTLKEKIYKLIDKNEFEKYMPRLYNAIENTLKEIKNGN